MPTLLVFLQNRRRWPIPVITVPASCYRVFLMHQNPVLDMKRHTFSLPAVPAWTLYTVFTKMHGNASR